MHPKLLVKTWRTRLYYYSSGSTFQRIAGDLKAWVQSTEDGDTIFRQVGLYVRAQTITYTFTETTYIVYAVTR